MGMKSSEISFTTRKSLADVGGSLQAAMARVKAQEIAQIESSSGALAAFDQRADIEIVGSGKTLLTGYWAVQVYVADEGEHRAVTLIALGDSGLSKAMHGAANSTWLSTSTKKRDEIASFLR